MTRREHARAARKLIKACGGLKEAADACRVGMSELSDYQSPTGKYFMPADVIFDLEQEAECRVYSRTLFERGPVATDEQSLPEQAAELTFSAVDIQRAFLAAFADRELTPNEVDQVLKQCADTRERLGEFEGRIAANAR